MLERQKGIHAATLQDVLKSEGPQIADVDVVLDRRPARVHAHHVAVQRGEGLHFSSGDVVEMQGHSETISSVVVALGAGFRLEMESGLCDNGIESTKSPVRSVFDLSPAEKLQLVEDLWDYLAANPDEVPIHDWQIAELARREANLQRYPASVTDWKA